MVSRINPRLPATVAVLLLLLLSAVEASVQAAPALQAASLADQVVYLTNLERAQEGLPPLKANPLLQQAAQAHAEAMAKNDFFDHNDPTTGTRPGDRITAAGYAWISVAENIAAGDDTAAGVMAGWMNSPGHRANILSPTVVELGVGYSLDSDDAFPDANVPYRHYWVQNFGTDANVFPVVIENEAVTIDSRQVAVYVYGEGWAVDMRVRWDEDIWEDWQPFQNQLTLELPQAEGRHVVEVELRDEAGQTRLASDDIYFSTALSTPTPQPEAATSTPTPQPVLPSGDEAVSLTKEAAPLSLVRGEEIEVRLTLVADNAFCGPEVVGKPVDIVLVLDHSSSMGDILSVLLNRGTSKLETAKRAAIAFVQEMHLQIDQVAIVQFDDRADLLQGLSGDGARIEATIQGISIGGSTAIDEGLRVAREEFNRNGRDNATPVIIILSDGGSNETSATREADRAKADGIHIVSVGVGTEVNQTLLTEIASERDGKKDVHFSPDTSDLETIYVAIAQQIREFATATNVRVQHTFDAGKVEAIPASISHAGVLTGATLLDTIEWEISALDDKPVVLSYRAVVKQPGEFYVDVRDEVDYLLCEREARAFVGQPVLKLQAIEPTPIATPTPAGPVVTPIPTPEPGLVENLPLSQPSLCSTQLWWLPALLLPLLLVALLVLLLWLWSRRNAVSWYNLWREWRWPCRILSLLLLLYLLFFAFLLGRELFAGLCKPTEAVYFWRLDNTGASGIYLTNQAVDAKAVPFKDINREGCIGCHAVSSASHQIAAVNGPIPGLGVIYTLAGEKVEMPSMAATYFAWSPQGERLAIADSGGDISILDVASGQLTPLAGASSTEIYETMPTWAPDGNTIAFVRSSTPLGVGGASIEGLSDILALDLASGESSPITGASGDGYNYYPAYSPDGQWLAFTRHTQGGSSYSDEAAEIFIVPAGGGTATRIRANDAQDGSALSGVSNSWPTWSRDGHWLAFNSKRNDPAFDVFVTEIDAEGNSGPGIPLPGASLPGVFEHTPFWGDPLQLLPLWQRLLNLWPWLLPLIPLLILRWLLCRSRRLPPIPPQGNRPEIREPVIVSGEWKAPPPEWRPAPTVILGLGGAGRHVLTHMKKNLIDAGAGEWRDQVQLIQIDVSTNEFVQNQEKQVDVFGIQLDEHEQVAMGRDLREVVRRMAADAAAEPEMQAWFPTNEYVNTRHLPDAQLDASKVTNQRRPMGRATVFKDIQRGDSSSLWQVISQAMRKLAAEEQMRVIVVGSLAGGFGSAVLTDVAYLARRAAQDAGKEQASAIITGMLLTDNAFNLHSKAPQLKLNSMATLRELSRFQLAGGRPLPMQYDRSSRDQRLNGFIDWALFDEIFLFDGQRSRNALTLWPPEQGMFPMIADILMAFVDRGSRLMEEVRSNLRTEAATVQLERGETVVSALGAYTYRLPLPDLVRALQLTFVRDLLKLYLSGESSEDAQRTSRSMRSGGPSSKSRAEHDALAEQFLRGQMSGQKEGAGGISTYIADLAQHGAYGMSWYNLSAGEVDAHLKHFDKTLVAVTTSMLQGAPGESDLLSASCGKLDDAMGFLQALISHLENARQRFLQVSPSLPDRMKDHGRQLERLITEEAGMAERVRGDVQVVKGRLEGSARRTETGRLVHQAGLIDRLNQSLAHEKEVREALAATKSRRILGDDKTIARLYDMYFAPHLVDKGLPALHWQQDKEGHLYLAAAVNGADAPAGSGSDPETLLQQLLKLAGIVGHTVWNLRLDTWFDDLESGLWQLERVQRQEAAEARDWSAPPTPVQTGKATQQQPHMYLWVNETVKTRDQFGRALQLAANLQNETQLLKATDPYSASVITSLDILPLSSLDCTTRIETEYRNAFQIGERSWGGATTVTPDPLHVHAAEQHALMYERRLGELREPSRLFHPHFVSALTDLERARTFAMAYALGWVRRTRYQEGGQWRDRYELHMPEEDAPLLLTQADRSTHPVALIVQAMQHFVLDRPAELRANLTAVNEGLAKRVAQAIETTLAQDVAPLQALLRAKPQDLSIDNRLGANDFWSFAQLVVGDELKGRLA